MATKKFESLSEEKKERIIHAALDEFSKKSYNEAAITTIVEKAGISRGSFYLYFENKESLYKYLINYLYIKHRKDLLKLLINKSGNLYNSLIDFFDFYINEIFESEYFAFYKNTFLHANHHLLGNEGLFNLDNQPSHREEQQQDFLEEIDIRNLKINSREEALEFIYLVVHVIHHMLIDEFINERPIHEIKEKSFRAVKWLCYGIQKDEEEPMD